MKGLRNLDGEVLSVSQSDIIPVIRMILVTVVLYENDELERMRLLHISLTCDLCCDLSRNIEDVDDDSDDVPKRWL